MADKKRKSFRIDEEKWEEFKKLVPGTEGISAAAKLRQMIYKYISENKD